MIAEVTAVEIFPGGLLNQLGGGEAAAVLPDVLAQPVEKGAEVPDGDGGIQPRQGFFSSSEQLGGIHRPKGVGREVTEAAVCPVDVLHTAVAVVIFGG